MSDCKYHSTFSFAFSLEEILPECVINLGNLQGGGKDHQMNPAAGQQLHTEPSSPRYYLCHGGLTSAVTRQGEVSRQGKHHLSVLGSQPLWVKDGVSFGSTSFIHENQELGLEMYSQLIEYLPACMRLWVQTPATHKPSVVSHDCTWFPSIREAKVGGSEFQCHSQLHGNLGASLSYVRFYLRTKTVKNWKHPLCIPGIIKNSQYTPKMKLLPTIRKGSIWCIRQSG